MGHTLGPVIASEGFKVGTLASNTAIISSAGAITGNVTGNLTGNVTGNLAGGTVVLSKSTEAAGSLPAVAAGKFQLFRSSSGGFILKTSTGVKLITVS